MSHRSVGNAVDADTATLVTPHRAAVGRGATSTVVDVVIVTYNSATYIGACLRSIARAYGRDATVTVVDNGSTDNTLAVVEAEFPATRVIAMGVNAGFARANNRGFGVGSAPYVLVLNPDTQVADSALEVLIAFANEHPRAGVVAPRLANPDGTDQRTARSFPTPAAAVWGRRSPLTRLFPGNPWSATYLSGSSEPGGQAFRVDWVSGAAMLIPRAIVDETGGFDERFFLFWEDADWCRRIKDAGYEVWCVPAAGVVHDEGGSRAHGWSPTTIRAFHAGAYLYWTKHHAARPWNPLRWLAAGLLACRAAVLIVRSRVSSGRVARVPTDRSTDARKSE